MSFQDNFLWGAASAAHQVEGAAGEDGKGEGIWDHFGHLAGNIVHGENGDVACDHYHRMKEDVALMKQIGLKSYRFSVSWPRVLPEGSGTVNEKGLQFYSDLVDELLAAGIEPLVTIYHWNMPFALYQKGGWSNDSISDDFAEYTRVLVERLSDRVQYWMTLNEPQMFMGLGHMVGFHAPFEKRDDQTLIQMTKNVLLAHGKAVKAIREHAKKTPIIGLAPTGDVYLPKSKSQADVEEARRRSFELRPFDFVMGNIWWADPIFLGKYPEGSQERFGDSMYQLTEEEWKLVSAPLDFYGCNVYQGTVDYPLPQDGYDEYGYQGAPKSNIGWNLTPDALYWSPKFLYERYKKPIMITENGFAGIDWVSIDDKVHDPQRIDFLHRYLLALEKVIEDGVPVIGYQLWSIMDNFEWSSGYDPRFGIVHIDYRTMKRTLKDSAYWYADVIRTNGGCL